MLIDPRGVPVLRRAYAGAVRSELRNGQSVDTVVSAMVPMNFHEGGLPAKIK
jgi:hypothetical protein